MAVSIYHSTCRLRAKMKKPFKISYSLLVLKTSRMDKALSIFGMKVGTIRFAVCLFLFFYFIFFLIR
jgi:hypothetical protein